MKTLKIMLVVAALAMVVSACHADFNFSGISARSLGMGGASVAVADDAFAWFQNPAGLASLAAAPKEGSKWSWDVAAESTFSTQDSDGSDHTAWGLSLSACDPAQGMGFGIGGGQDKFDNDKTQLWGAGFGIKGRDDSTKDWAIGANVHREDETVTNVVQTAQTTVTRSIDTETVYDLGLMYNVKVAETLPVKIGFVIRNLSDKSDGRSYIGGVSFKASDRVLVAADLMGIGQRSRNWAVGGEYKVNEWAFRAGDASGALALGAGYQWNNWCLDYAHTQKDGSKTNLVTVSTHF
jgi:hypothetical protein